MSHKGFGLKTGNGGNTRKGVRLAAMKIRMREYRNRGEDEGMTGQKIKEWRNRARDRDTEGGINGR